MGEKPDAFVPEGGDSIERITNITLLLSGRSIDRRQQDCYNINYRFYEVRCWLIFDGCQTMIHAWREGHPGPAVG
jgi:hypothetical protein